MGQSDKWFRWSLNLFVFLMCFQLGMLLFLKSLFYSAEKKLKDNEAKVSFNCGDFNNEEAYWNIPESETSLSGPCLDFFCPDSFWKNPEPQDEDFHVIAIKKAQPSYREKGKSENGYFVDVKVTTSEKPMTLALISQSMMQWNLKVAEESNLKEVLIIGSDLVWVEGLPADVKLTYFTKEQICAFPTAWEEIKNPENEFRRAMSAMVEYTGKKPTSFQGKQVAKEFRIPFHSALMTENKTKTSQRNIASQEINKLTLGMKWLREEKNLKAQFFEYNKNGKIEKIEVPEKTMDAFYEVAKKEIYIIKNYQFGQWDSQNKKFTAMHLPLEMPAMYWPTNMTFNSLKSELYIYNEDRGGEILSFNVVTKKWKRFAQKVGYSLVALYFDNEEQTLYGSQFQGRQIDSMLKFNQKGQTIGKVNFVKPLDFSKNRWKAQMINAQNEIWLKLTHPANPNGDVYPLSQLKSL
jgi:hypothetical protein